MPLSEPRFVCRMARDASELAAAQRLRYEVFVEELGADGPLVDHDSRREADRFDPFNDHLVLLDEARQEAGQSAVVGVYRLLSSEAAARAGQFYSETEYDLSPLKNSGRRLLELGRSCLHRDYRGGSAMMHLWAALAEHVEQNGFDILFGVASFHGTNIAQLAAPLSVLHHRHLAPPGLRVRAREPQFQSMDLLPENTIDRPTAMRAVPALIKAYLRLGGFVGEGAYVDHGFNTTDVCLVLDTAQVNSRQRHIYSRPRT